MKNSSQQRPVRILLADDGSKHSRAAASLIRDLPLPADSEIVAIAVLSPLQASEHGIFEANLDRTKAFFGEKGIEARTELLLGYPAQVLVNYADDFKPDLIVMGAKGLRATLGILLGGVAQQVVEYANWPVLVVRAPYPGLKRILLVTDGSEFSQCALEYLSGLERVRIPLPANVEVNVMHVLPPVIESHMLDQYWPAGSETIFPSQSYPVLERHARPEEQEKEGKRLLDRTIKTLVASGIQTTSVLARGDAATEIIRYVRENDVNLIVAGSRGLGQVRGWLLGSVSRKLVHYAGCSVLIVKEAAD